MRRGETNEVLQLQCCRCHVKDKAPYFGICRDNPKFDLIRMTFYESRYYYVSIWFSQAVFGDGSGSRGLVLLLYQGGVIRSLDIA